MNVNYLLIYDLPFKKSSLRVKINRILHKSLCKKLMSSVWEGDLQTLKFLKELIEANQGKALILEKKVIE